MIFDNNTIIAVAGAIVAVCTVANNIMLSRQGRKLDQHAVRSEETHAETLDAIESTMK